MFKGTQFAREPSNWRCTQWLNNFASLWSWNWAQWALHLWLNILFLSGFSNTLLALNAKFLFVWNKRVTLKCDIPESAPNCGYWLPSYNLCDKEGWLFVHCRQLQASTQTFALFVAWVFSCYLAANVIKLSVLQSDPRWIDNLLSFQEWLAWI